MFAFIISIAIILNVYFRSFQEEYIRTYYVKCRRSFKDSRRKTLYSNATFQINPGDKVGLVGPNGTGKTTLFRMIIGDGKAMKGKFLFRIKCAGLFLTKSGEMAGKTAHKKSWKVMKR